MWEWISRIRSKAFMMKSRTRRHFRIQSGARRTIDLSAMVVLSGSRSREWLGGGSDVTGLGVCNVRVGGHVCGWRVDGSIRGLRVEDLVRFGLESHALLTRIPAVLLREHASWVDGDVVVSLAPRIRATRKSLGPLDDGGHEMPVVEHAELEGHSHSRQMDSRLGQVDDRPESRQEAPACEERDVRGHL